MRWFYLRDANRRLIGCVASTPAQPSNNIDLGTTYRVKYASAICSETDNYHGYTTRAFKEHARCYAIGRLVQDIKTTTIEAPKDAIVRSILLDMLFKPSTPYHARRAISLKLDIMSAIAPAKLLDAAAAFGSFEAQINDDTASTIPALEQAERVAEVAADVGITLPTEPEPVYVFHAPSEPPHPSSDDAALDRLFSDFHGDHSH